MGVFLSYMMLNKLDLTQLVQDLGTELGSHTEGREKAAYAISARYLMYFGPRKPLGNPVSQRDETLRGRFSNHEKRLKACVIPTFLAVAERRLGVIERNAGHPHQRILCPPVSVGSRRS
jgi:hypothetical protein